MSILHLTLKKKWFDMIASGEKKEEYREIKKYWQDRLCCTSNILDGFQDFDEIIFKHGYSSGAPLIVVECKGIGLGEGKAEWGAEPGKEYFIIKLGNIVNHEQQ